MPKLNKQSLEDLQNNKDVEPVFESTFASDYDSSDNQDKKIKFILDFRNAIAENWSIQNLVLQDPSVEVMEMMMTGLNNRPSLPHITIRGTLTADVAEKLTDGLQKDGFSENAMIRLECEMADDVATQLAQELVGCARFAGFIYGKGVTASTIKAILSVEDFIYCGIGIAEGLDRNIFNDEDVIKRLKDKSANVDFLFLLGDIQERKKFLANRKETQKFLSTFYVDCNKKTLSLYLSGDPSKSAVKTFLDKIQSFRKLGVLCFYQEVQQDVVEDVCNRFVEKCEHGSIISFKSLDDENSINTVAKILQKQKNAKRIVSSCLFDIHKDKVFTAYKNFIKEIPSIKRVIVNSIATMSCAEMLNQIAKMENISSIVLTGWIDQRVLNSIKNKNDIIQFDENIKVVGEDIEVVDEEEYVSIHMDYSPLGSKKSSDFPAVSRLSLPKPKPEPISDELLVGHDDFYPQNGVEYISLDAADDGTCAFYAIAIKLGLLIKHGHLEDVKDSEPMQTLLKRMADFHPNFQPATWENLHSWIDFYTGTNEKIQWKGSHRELEYLLGPVLRLWYLFENDDNNRVGEESYDEVAFKLSTLAKLAEEYKFSVGDEVPKWVCQRLQLGLYMETRMGNQQVGFSCCEPVNNNPLYVVHLKHNGLEKGGHYDVTIEKKLVGEETEHFFVKNNNPNCMLQHFINSSSNIYFQQFVFPSPEVLQKGFVMPKVKKNLPETMKWKDVDVRPREFGFKKFIWDLRLSHEDFPGWGLMALDQRKDMLRLFEEFNTFYYGLPKPDKNGKKHIYKSFLEAAQNHPETIRIGYTQAQCWYHSFGLFEHGNITGEDEKQHPDYSYRMTLLNDVTEWFNLGRDFKSWFAENHVDPEVNSATKWFLLDGNRKSEIKAAFKQWSGYENNIRQCIALLFGPYISENMTVCHYFQEYMNQEQRNEAIKLITDMLEVGNDFIGWLQHRFHTFMSIPKYRQELEREGQDTLYGYWLSQTETAREEMKENFQEWRGLDKNYKIWLNQQWQTSKFSNIREGYPTVEFYFFFCDDNEKAQLQRDFKNSQPRLPQRPKRGAIFHNDSPQVDQSASRVIPFHEKKLCIQESDVIMLDKKGNRDLVAELQNEQGITGGAVIIFKNIKTANDMLSILTVCFEKGINKFVLGEGLNYASGLGFVSAVGRQYPKGQFYIHMDSSVDAAFANIMGNALKPNTKLEVSLGDFKVKQLSSERRP